MTSSAPEVRLVSARVHGRVLVRAAPGDAPAGFLFGFHGYLENAATQLVRLQDIPGSDRWTLVSIQALHRVYRGRSEETVASWMTREDRDVAIADNIAYVQAVVRDLGIGGGRPVVCAGFSQGGAMAFRAALRGGFAAAGVVSLGADVPPELLADDGLRFPPVLLLRGARDEWLAAEKFEADGAALRKHGGDVRALVLDAGHEWTTAASRAAGDFLRTLEMR